MSDLHSANGSPAGEAEGSSADDGWRAAQEVRSLLDTLSLYRRCVVDLAAENDLLREEVAVLRAIATPASPADRPI